MSRRVLTAEALPGYEPEIGQWLCGMQETRRRTIRLVRDLDQRTLDWRGPDAKENSIGSLLYHIAGVEMGWLYFDMLGRSVLPDEVKADFPFPAHDPDRRLMHVPSIPASEHIARLDRTRTTFLRTLQGMSLDEWHRLRSPAGEDYDCTPAWIVFHLVEHEAGHAFQISSLVARANRHFFR